MLFTTKKTDIAPKYQIHTWDRNNVKDFHENTSNTISLRALYTFFYMSILPGMFTTDLVMNIAQVCYLMKQFGT